MSKASENLRADLDVLRDSLIQAIRSRRTSGVRDGFEVYVDLVRRFVSTLAKWGVPYDRTRTLQETSSLRGSWAEIEWIRDDLRDIIDEGFASERATILDNVLYLPVRLSVVAYFELDYFTFHQFLSWMPYCYISALKLDDQELKRFAIDRCWRFLRETADLVLVQDLQRTVDVAALVKKGEFAVGIILSFSRLIKTAFDFGRRDDAERFSRVLKTLFEHYHAHREGSALKELDWNLSHLNLSSEERRTFQDRREQSAAHAKLSNDLNMARDIALFSLNALILQGYDAKRLGPDECREWRNAIAFKPSWERTWTLLLEARKFETGRMFGWDMWQFEGRDDVALVKTGWGGFEPFLELFAIVNVIELLGHEPAQRPDASLALPRGAEIASLVSEGGPLRSSLMRVQREQEAWGTVIGTPAIEAIPRLLVVFDRAVKVQREEEEHRVIEGEVQDRRILKVGDNIRLAWERDASVRAIVKSLDAYQFLDTHAPKGVGYFGINTLDRKDIYVEDLDLYWEDWGVEYGRSLAHGENEHVLKAIVGALPPHAEGPQSLADLLAAVDTSLGSLRKERLSPAIMVIDSWFAVHQIEHSPHFSPKQHDHGNERFDRGRYRGAPVVALSVGDSPVVLIVDVASFCQWRQYRPVKSFDAERYLSDELLFMVKPYTLESAEEYMRSAPDYAKEIQEGPRSIEEIRREIMQRVHLRVVEQFELLVTRPSAGVRIPVRD
jgi:hypothetical protein